MLLSPLRAVSAITCAGAGSRKWCWPRKPLHRLILGEYASLMLHCDVRAMKRVQQVG